MNPFFLTFNWIEIDPHPDGEIVEFSDARTTYAPTSMITEGEALTPTFPNGCASNHSNSWLRQSQCLQPQLFKSDLSDQKRHQYEIKRIVHLAILDQKDHQFLHFIFTLSIKTFTQWQNISSDCTKGLKDRFLYISKLTFWTGHVFLAHCVQRHLPHHRKWKVTLQ